MSILIKGMEMPKNCMDCPMNYDSIDCTLVFDISLRDKDNEFMYEDKRHPNCPLIELPPHGRLIDADAATKQGWTINRTYSASPNEMVYEVKTMDDDVLPTIIPADESDMDSFIHIFEEDDEEDGMDSFIRILKD